MVCTVDRSLCPDSDGGLVSIYVIAFWNDSRLGHTPHVARADSRQAIEIKCRRRVDIGDLALAIHRIEARLCIVLKKAIVTGACAKTSAEALGEQIKENTEDYDVRRILNVESPSGSLRRWEGRVIVSALHREWRGSSGRRLIVRLRTDEHPDQLSHIQTIAISIYRLRLNHAHVVV